MSRQETKKHETIYTITKTYGYELDEEHQKQTNKLRFIRKFAGFESTILVNAFLPYGIILCRLYGGQRYLTINIPDAPSQDVVLPLYDTGAIQVTFKELKKLMKIFNR